MRVKKVGLYGLVIMLLICCAAVSVSGLAAASYADAYSLEGEGDNFAYREESYEAGEAFVYSATVNFAQGTAAGLVFGAAEDGSCFVFNVDRAANRVKLIYFYKEGGQTKAVDLKNEYYVGSALMNEGERNYVKSRTANIDKVYLKVAVNADKSAEFYADGIRRFAYTDGSEEAAEIMLDGLTPQNAETEIRYNGGLIGYNCYYAKVTFSDILVGETDYGYYGELYRNQYHFSQFAHWNNDPNGLVYYNGYYHLYFQHNPYGNTWDTMHWGHARSKDLVHWEMMPIALVPDYDLPEGDNKRLGAMWSGSAMVYHKGDSAAIDELNWFGDASEKQEGDALGLIGWYTWFGDGGNLYQVTMYSTDGGLSWHKSVNIPCGTSLDLDGNAVTGGSWRDPKVFDISSINGITDGYKWGMALTDMEDRTIFFLKSKDLVNWQHAGCYEMYTRYTIEGDPNRTLGPECPDVVTVDGYTVITFTSRYYAVCKLGYADGLIVLKDENGNAIDKKNSGANGLNKHLQTMDFGVDSYAAQSFYIDAESDSAYKGKTVALSWFSGVPNVDRSAESGVFQNARKVWNGGGMTIPVVYGLTEKDGKHTLTTTPITYDDAHFAELKEEVTEGIDGINGHCFEIKAQINNAEQEPVKFKINMSADGKHFTEIGWNSEEGYYVDRTHTEDAGIVFPKPNYACRYASYMGKSNTALDFYILSDNGGVEVYCDGFTVPFYVLTLASPHSVKATMEKGESAIVETLTVNTIASVWRDDAASEETLINLWATRVDLGMELGQTQTVTAYAQGKEIAWEIAQGEENIEIEPTAEGVRITAKKAGTAQVKATVGKSSRTIDVAVHTGSAESDFTFESSGIVSGTWYYDGNNLVGDQAGGDGFILAEESGTDFTYTARFDLGSGAAAALVLRATEENGKLTSYLIANYDKPGKIVKLWSQNGEIARSSAGDVDVKNLVITAEAKGKNIKIYLCGNKLIDATIRDNDPVSGRFGLNVCATKAEFASVTVLKSEYDYSGSGDLVITGNVSQQILGVTNVTLANSSVAQGWYETAGRELKIAQAYMELLPEAGEYSFIVRGSQNTFAVKVNVADIPATVLRPVTVDEGANTTIWLGNADVQFVKVNGEEIDESLYEISGYKLTVLPSALGTGENTVEINGTQSVTVTVIPTPKSTVTDGNVAQADEGCGCGGEITASHVIFAAAVLAAAVALAFARGKNKKEDRE